jgi:2-oxo-3-hexenedioate decarboxylase
MPHTSKSHEWTQQAEALAAELRLATERCQPTEPLTQRHPALSVAEAYIIQQAGIDYQLSLGERVIGYKLGFTSAAKQVAMGIHEPIYGVLLASMQLEAPQPLSLASLIHPKVEPEIAFVLRSELAGPHVTAHDVLAATQSLHPALDVLDSRFEGFRFALPDVIADNASGAGFILGAGVAPLAFDALAACQAAFYRQGQRVSEGTGRDVMGHPAEAVAWLVRQLSAGGRGLAAGDIVLSGSLVAPVNAAVGDTFEARIDGLGSVALTIEKGAR